MSEPTKTENLASCFVAAFLLIGIGLVVWSFAYSWDAMRSDVKSLKQRVEKLEGAK